MLGAPAFRAAALTNSHLRTSKPLSIAPFTSVEPELAFTFVEKVFEHRASTFPLRCTRRSSFHDLSLIDGRLRSSRKKPVERCAQGCHLIGRIPMNTLLADVWESRLK